jgi:hypothetical protein
VRLRFRWTVLLALAIAAGINYLAIQHDKTLLGYIKECIDGPCPHSRAEPDRR